MHRRRHTVCWDGEPITRQLLNTLCLIEPKRPEEQSFRHQSWKLGHSLALSTKMGFIIQPTQYIPGMENGLLHAVIDSGRGGPGSTN